MVYFTFTFHTKSSEASVSRFGPASVGVVGSHSWPWLPYWIGGKAGRTGGNRLSTGVQEWLIPLLPLVPGPKAPISLARPGHPTHDALAMTDPAPGQGWVD